MYKKSIKIFETIYYLRSFWLGSMISILFLKFIGLTDIDIGIFHFIGGALIFFLEIPTGSFADKYGYRKSIILSFLFLALAFLSLVLGLYFGKYIIFIFTALFFSLHSSFSSGASDSYIYSIFRKESNLKNYTKFKTKVSRNSRIIEGIAILIGANLYVISEYLPYLIQFFLISFAFLLTLFLKDEPVIRGNKKIEGKINKSLEIFFSKKIFLYLLIFMIFSVISFEYFHHVINQSIFLEIGISVEKIGILGFLVYILSGFFVHFTDYIWNIFGEFKSYLFLTLLSLLSGIGFLLSKNFIFIIILTSLLGFTRASKYIILDNSIQFRIKNDENRATLISIFSMFTNMPIKFLFIIFGLILGGFSYVESMSIVSGLFGFISIVILFFYKSKFVSNF